MNLNTTIVIDYVITKLIRKCDQMIYNNKIARTIPSYLKQEQMMIIRSAIDLHQINPDDTSKGLTEDEEYTNKPKFDSFQSYTLKMQVPFMKIQIPNQPQRILRNRQSSLSQPKQQQQLQNVKQQQQQQQQSIQLQKQRSISHNSELQLEQASFLYQKPNLNNSHQIKLKVKELSKHMFIDRTNPEQFKQQFLNLVQQAQQTDTPQIYRISRIVGQEPLLKQTYFYQESKSTTIKRNYSPNTTSTGTNFRIRKQSIQ